MKKVKIKALVEAALFISSEPITKNQLKSIVDAKEKETENAIKQISEEFNNDNHGIELFQSNQGYELRVKPYLLDHVSHLTPHSDLSRGPLKVLALVAFKQPIKQSTIAKIIGNRAYSYIKDLEDRGLIRTEKHSRTKKLMITKEFKQYFGIEDKKELEKRLKEKLGDVADTLLKESPE